jgi:AbrB family looped-hinge helix DNA binding protein
MFASSFLGASFEIVIPEPVRQALNLLEGDLLVFEVDETGSLVSTHVVPTKGRLA